jgi:hypothetical protein
MQTCKCVRSARWACTRTSKHVMHAYFFGVIYNERWTLISFGDICVPACHCCCGYTLTIPPSHTLPYYPRTQHHPCPLSQARSLGGDSHPRSWVRGGKTYDWRAAAPILVVFVLTAICTMVRQDLTPGLAPTQHPCMQPHFTPTSSPPTLLSHVHFGYKLPASAQTWACPHRR